MTNTDHCFPLSIYLSASCFHASIVATKDKETHWSSKNLKIVSFQETQNPSEKKKENAQKGKKGGRQHSHRGRICVILISLSNYSRGVF